MRNAHSRRILFFLTLVAGYCILSAAFGQMFQTTPSESKTPPGINRIPPPLPVLSPGEFQSQVQSQSEDNRKAMSQQGLSSIQQQLDTLPAVKPGEPPAMAKPSDNDNGSGQPSSANAPSRELPTGTAPPPAATSSTPPAPSEPPSNTGSTDNSYTAPKSSSPSSSGGLNIQY